MANSKSPLKTRHWMAYLKKEIVSKKETAKGTSKTIPDQAITVGELIERAKNGTPVNQYFNMSEAVYNNDFEIPNVNKLDFTDIDEMRKSVLIQKAKIEADLNQLDEDKDGVPDVLERLTNVLESLDHRSKELDDSPPKPKAKA